MSGGSLQLRLYRLARADGADTLDAATFAGIDLREAMLIDADDAKSPPLADWCTVPAVMLRGWTAQGDQPTLAALCGPWGRVNCADAPITLAVGHLGEKT